MCKRKIAAVYQDWEAGLITGLDDLNFVRPYGMPEGKPDQRVPLAVVGV
jgi:hypothetical protein